MSRRYTYSGSSFASGPAWDPDTVAYMNALGIVADSTIYFPSTAQEIDGLGLWYVAEAYITGHKDMNVYSPLWHGYDVSKTIIACLYPTIGGTSARHAINACDPRNLDAAFRLAYNGTWTHSGTGALPSVANGSANTFFNPAVQTTLVNASSFAMAAYIRTNNNSGISDMGNYPSAGPTGQGLGFLCSKFRTDTDGYYRCMGTGSDIAVNGITDARGFTMINTASSGNRKFIKNGIILNTNTAATEAVVRSLNVVIGAGNAAQFFGGREIAGALIASGLGVAQESGSNTLIVNMNTSLNRNV